MHFESSAGTRALDDVQELVLENYGAGYAWMRQDTAVRPRPISPFASRLMAFAHRFAAATRPLPRYALTDLGRRDLAIERLFGPWPTVADAFAQQDQDNG